MNWVDLVQKVDFNKAVEIFTNIEKAAEQSRMIDRDYIQSTHSNKCPKCHSHPVNHVKRRRTICRKCGISFVRNTVGHENRTYYQGSTVLRVQ